MDVKWENTLISSRQDMWFKECLSIYHFAGCFCEIFLKLKSEEMTETQVKSLLREKKAILQT